MKDWKVKKYGHRYGENIPYPWWVEGEHAEDGSPFFWIVPDITHERYDFSEAVLCEDVKQSIVD